MQAIAVLVFTLLLCTLITAHSDTLALKYLLQFGYMPTPSGNFNTTIDEKVFENAIADFQAMAGLKITGKVDSHTHEMMMVPRCGMKDNMGTGGNRAKRYLREGGFWTTKDLTYKISRYPNSLQSTETDKVIQMAFDVWTRYTDFTFTPKTGKVHIEILFHGKRYKYGDGFDGPSMVLAHAFSPDSGGDIHFDESENWTINYMEGGNSIHLFQVAAHEIGHSLGLGHSTFKDALMAPFYNDAQFFDLNTDDIAGIQAIYGKKTTSTRGKNPSGQSPPTDQSLCDVPKIDTIFKSAEGHTYVFKGDKFWKIKKNYRVAPGYPKLISDNWIGLPGNIDAAFTHNNGDTYFFKGSQYWRYRGTKFVGLLPKKISWLFSGVPNNLDAAMVRYGSMYFFKGNKYWRFKFNPRQIAISASLSDWIGVPSNLNAALQSTKGYTYFFKNDAYYRFNHNTFAVQETTPAFPRSSAHWWFGCKGAPSGTIKTN